MAIDSRLYRLTDDAFVWLYNHIDDNLDVYTDPKTDFHKILNDEYKEPYLDPVDATIDPPLSLKNPSEYHKSSKKTHMADVQALNFYKSLKGVTPRLASDPCVLAYLNHFHMHPYGVLRWPVGDARKKMDTAVKHVRQHWLTQSKQRLWNASISGRMWWIAHVATTAADASGGAFEPAQALDLFSMTPEYYHRTMEYDVLRNPVLMAECILALLNEARGINRDGYREVGMELNRDAGARVLDSLDRARSRSMVRRSVGRVIQKPEYVRNRHDLVGVNKLKVLSLGAGVQSTVLALMAEVGWGGLEKPDLAIFADTQWEPEAVYEHLEWLKSNLSYEVATVTAGNIKDNMLRGVNPDGDRFLDVPVFVSNPNGTKAVAARQCTTHYKIRPIYKEIKKRLNVKTGKRVPKDKQVEMWLGISADESSRIKPSKDEWIDRRFPLVDMDLTRADAFKWFNENYPGRRLPRSACVGCPYHDDMEWGWIKENEPDSFRDAVHVDWSLRNVPAARGSLRGTAYLHKSRKPLDTIDFSEAQNYDDYMIDECEGLCGV